MPTPKMSAEAMLEAVGAWEGAGRSVRGGAESLGLNYYTFRSRLDKAKAQGMHLSPGVRAQIEAGKLSPSEARAGWQHVYDPEGKKVGTTYWKAPDVTESDSLLERIASAFQDIPAAPPIIQSEHSQEGKIAFFPHSDVHLGVDIDADRGGTDYTPEIAVERLKDGFSQVHSSIPPCETAVILNNGDLTHANDDRDVTVKSQHRLKVRGSHRSNLRLATMATAWQIDMALQRSARVVYRANRGNHDPNTPDTLSIALSMRYADNPRVTIDASEREIWVYQRGLVFLATWHGDKQKPEAICANLPAIFPDQFGASRFWYGFTGHYHGPKHGVHGAIHWFQLPAVCALDQHSADAGYGDDSAMRAMMFCERGGLKHDMTVRF